MDKIMVSDSYARAVRTYILNKYNLSEEKGVYQNYKRIYTLNDKTVFYGANSKFLFCNQELLTKRLNNFLILSSLKNCNSRDVFDEILPEYGGVEYGVLFLDSEDILKLVYEAPERSVFSHEDILVDCIMVTLNQNTDGFWEIIADYFCLMID